MNIENCKQYLFEQTGVNVSNWNKVSENKKGTFDVIVFKNALNNENITVVSNDNHYPEVSLLSEIPKDFWISVNKENFDVSDIDDNASYFDENADLDDGVENTVQVVFKNPDDSDGEYWYDQEVTYLMENFYGVKNFSSVFHECMENCSILSADKTISDIKDMLESKGLRFIGYKNFFEE